MNLCQSVVVFAVAQEAPFDSGPGPSNRLFQFIALAVVGGLFALSLVALFRGWASRREGLAWAFVWLCTGVAIAYPELTVRIARRLGIGRGADLVLYCAVIVMLIGFFMVYARLRRLRRDLTLLSRHLAIRDATTTTGTDRLAPPTPPPGRFPTPLPGKTENPPGPKSFPGRT